jgi:hypothetical protein
MHNGLKGLSLRGGEQRWHLHQPARRVLAQQQHDLGTAWPPTESCQSLQDWQIGFPSAIVVDALAMAYPDVFRHAQVRHKAVNQGSFANTRFTCDKPHLSFPLERPGEPLVELRNFGLTPNKDPRRSDDGGYAACFSNLMWLRRLLHHCKRGNKPVSSPTHGLDKLRLTSLISKRLAQLSDDDGQDGFTYHSLGPNGVQQGLFRHQPACLRQQTVQDRKRFGADPYRLAALPKALIAKIQEKRCEDEILVIWHTSPPIAARDMTSRPVPAALFWIIFRKLLVSF